ncbi:MAG: hypothetical protein GWP14_02050 [Actinobacteria bacterium]|nr:hypothetical protein [Actinomycetota bacterium]
MATQHRNMICDLYQSAFSGEVVFAVNTISGERYEGVAPKHYAEPVDALSSDPIQGWIKVWVISNGGKSSLIRIPDGETINVPLDLIALPGK